MEWYEVMRQSIDELSVTPVAILNHGELMVYELDENELMGDYPGTEPIALAYKECVLNPAFMARLVHARFPVIFYPVTKKQDGFATDFYQLDDMPLRPEALNKYEGMNRVWNCCSGVAVSASVDQWHDHRCVSERSGPTRSGRSVGDAGCDGRAARRRHCRLEARRQTRRAWRPHFCVDQLWQWGYSTTASLRTKYY